MTLFTQNVRILKSLAYVEYKINHLHNFFTFQLTFCHLMSIDERLSYTAHPDDPSKTLLTQEAVVTVRGIPLSSYLEGFLTNTISLNANKGRQVNIFYPKK